MNNTSDPPTQTKRRSKKYNDLTSKSTTSKKNDTRRIEITPQALLPKIMRQSYLDCNSNLLQLRSKTIDNSKTETFGDPINEKHQDTIRLTGQNIGCLGVRSFGNQKQEQGKNWLIKNSVDVCCWQELGIALHMLKHQERIQERMKDYRWTRTRISASNNRHESIDKLQFGGTMTMAVNETATRVHASGADEKGLGRWTWLLFEGHNNYRTRIISAYVPCKSNSGKDATVYQQQKRYYESQGIRLCPRALMIKELTDLIKTWEDKGENIVLFIDCNENLHKQGQIQRLLVGDKCKLIDPIRRKFGTANAPPTYHRNNSYPIDSVFVSKRLRHITYGGWLRFGEGIGDHRVIYIDLPVQLLLGENKFVIPPPSVRRLKCNDPRVVDRFNTILEEQYRQHKTLTRIEHLNQTFHIPLNETEQIELEKIDRISTFAVRHADKKCRKLCMGEVPYSHKLNAAGDVVGFWRLVIRKKLGCHVSTSLIKKTARSVGIDKHMTLKLDECRDKQKAAYKLYNEVKRNAPKYRYDMLDNKADEADNKGDPTLAKAIRAMKTVEEARKTHRKIKIATKPFGGAVSRLNIEDPMVPEGRRTTTDPIEIETSLMNEYEQKYRLAYSSPLLQDPMRDELGDQGLTQQTEQVLLGEYIPPLDTTQATRRFLEQSKMTQRIADEGPNDDVITTEQCNSFWRSMKEKVQSSKSNKHVGTYKAASLNPTNATIQTRLMSIPYQSGYSLKRWQESLNVSLLKKQERYAPEDLRTIWYMEADCNGGSKIHFARRMMHRAQDNNLISECQYAQKGKKAIEAALVKVLFLDHLRITKQAGSLTMNDLMQCFDRMCHSVCSLATRRLGTGPRVLQSMLTTIQRMKHFIRTAYGDSRHHYGNDARNPLQGGGQGNGASMPFFVAISSILIPLLEQHVECFKIYSAISLTVLALIAIIYVDDSDFLIAAKHPTDTPQSIVRRTQQAANIWQQSVHQTGGAIRPHKCRWSLVAFKWKNGIPYYKRNDEVNGILKIKDTDGVREVITRLQPDESEEGLGIHIPVNGSQWNQIENINNKTAKWIDGITKNSLTKREVYISMTTSVCKTVAYSLTATSIDEKMMMKVSTPIFKAALPRMGILPTLPIAFRYASSRYQGIDMMNFNTEQLVQKSEIFLTHINQNTQVGTSLLLCLEDIQLEVGITEHLFDLPFHEYGHLTQNSWIRHLWKECWKHNIKLKGTYNKPKLQRENDICLMQQLIGHNNFTKKQIAAINRCRIYLQALTLSDIANGTGSFVTKMAYEGIKDQHRKSKWIWPNQAKPQKKDWRLWKDAIEMIWTQTGTRRIRNELGDWIEEPHQHYNWNYSPSQDKLYWIPSPDLPYERPMMENETVLRRTFKYEYTRTHRRIREATIFHDPRIVLHQPDDLEATTVEERRGDVVQYSGSRPQLKPDENDFNTFDEYIDSLPDDTKRLLEHTQFPDNGLSIAHAIRTGTALAVTDGSYNEELNSGAAAWIIVGSDDSIKCEGRIGQYHTSETMDSYRAESLGVLAVITATEHICRYHRIKSGGLTVACDNDASLEKGIDNTKRMKTTNKYFDIFWSIDERKHRIPVTLTSKKVKGHQDKKKSKRNLTRVERLNCYVDIEAKKYRKWLERTNEYEPPTTYGDNNWSLWMNGEKITKDIRKRIIDHIQGSKIKEHISRTNEITMQVVENIDWDGIERAAKSLTISRKIWLMKHVSGFAPTASKMVHRNEWDTNLCPQCQKHKEDVDHIMICKHPDAYEKRMKSIVELKKWMESAKTSPQIVECIILTMIAGPNATFEEMLPGSADQLIRDAATEQDAIGWNNLCKGRLSKTWRKVQQNYLLEQNLMRRRSSKSWCANFILHLYEVVHTQWEHRNSVITKATKEKASITERNKLACEIRKQFEVGKNTLRPNDHYLLDEGIERILQRTIKSQKYWLRRCNVSREYTRKSEKNMLEGMRNIMNAWAIVPD